MASENGGNGTETTQESLGFDVEAWKRQGQEHIDLLVGQINAKISQKLRLDQEINMLVEKKVTIEKALGLHTAQKTKTKRIQIKPVLLQVFHENEGQVMDIDTIVEKVQAEQPEANEKKIRGALGRFVDKDDRIHVFGDGFKFVSAEG